MDISLTINGEVLTAEVPSASLLSDILRDTHELTGTHIGCDTSQCGACHVMLDGLVVKSCTILAAQAEGCSVVTIEGIAGPDGLHPMQAAFKAEHGLQCGFCTPGMVMAGLEIVRRHGTDVSAEQVSHDLEGNLCRCTGYINIVKAIVTGARAMGSNGGGTAHA